MLFKLNSFILIVQLYQVRLWTLNTVGSSPPSEWFTIQTIVNNLRENTIPDEPTNFKG